MSQYINSFLIEPVVRQARRFSRPSFGSEIPPQEHGTEQDAAASDEVVMATSSQEERLDSLRQEVERPRHDTMARSATVPEGVERRRPDMDGRHTRQSSNPLLSNVQYRSTDSPGILNTGLGNPRAGFSSTRRSISGTSAGSRPADSPGLSRSTTEQDAFDTSGGTYTPRVGDGVLPEDDGMAIMRRKIRDIQQTGLSNEEKSRRMHELLTEQYYISRGSPRSPPSMRPHSPGSLRSQDRPLTPLSEHSAQPTLHSPHTSVSTSPEMELKVLPEDLKPTYYTKKVQASTDVTPDMSRNNSVDEEIEVDELNLPLGCAHYKRNVKLQCFECHRWYTCRFCHDEVEDHSLNRKATKNMLCMLCGCAQSAAEACKDCGESGARYYCDVCKLWDDDPAKSIYHCNDCGICRIGEGLGKDFFHCHTCCVCLQISRRETHRCVERSLDSDCPICGEYMFTSPQPIVMLDCGHGLHQPCYYKLRENTYKCPICSRSIINMEMTFRQLDRAIEYQPMPAQFRNMIAAVYCNDCCAKSHVPYHWIGLKCAVCDSYNTAQIRIIVDDSQTTPAAEAVDNSADMPEVDMIQPETSQPVTRGRTATLRHYSSVSALEVIRDRREWPPQFRVSRSISGVRMGPSGESDPLSLQTSESMDVDDDDVDFWGGESPGRIAGLISKAMEQSEGEESSDDDDLMDAEGEDEDEDEDDDEAMGMELFGHR